MTLKPARGTCTPGGNEADLAPSGAPGRHKEETLFMKQLGKTRAFVAIGAIALIAAACNSGGGATTAP